MNNNKNEIVVSSPKYQEASIKFRAAWLEYMDHEERVKYEVVTLVKILEKDGYSRMKAVQKIINDHNDLKGFSKATIYRELPEDMKLSQKRDLQKLRSKEDEDQYISSGFSNEKREHLNKTNQSQQRESEALKDFREEKGTIVQSAKPFVDDTRNKEEEEPNIEQEVIYDSKFVDALIAENENLKNENFRLKKDYQELETKYNEVTEPYQVKDSIIVNDQEIPLIITVDPFRRTITIEVDQKEVKKLKRF